MDAQMQALAAALQGSSSHGNFTEDDGTHLASTDPHGEGSSLPLHSSGIRLRSNMTSGSFPDP